MNQCGLEQDIHFKDAKNLTRKSDGLKYGQVSILESKLSKCNKE